MNALANSQLQELEKFIEQAGLSDRLRPTFARYTGQESVEERERIRGAKPDILLTNFMMLELLMTRQNALDRAVIGNAQDLEFIVLDELHTHSARRPEHHHDSLAAAPGATKALRQPSQRKVAAAGTDQVFEVQLPPKSAVPTVL
jgi:hypothetical protein